MRTWAVGIGTEEAPSPIGPFTIRSKDANPTWIVPDDILPHDGQSAARRASRTREPNGRVPHPPVARHICDPRDQRSMVDRSPHHPRVHPALPRGPRGALPERRPGMPGELVYRADQDRGPGRRTSSSRSTPTCTVASATSTVTRARSARRPASRAASTSSASVRPSRPSAASRSTSRKAPHRLTSRQVDDRRARRRNALVALWSARRAGGFSARESLLPSA